MTKHKKLKMIETFRQNITPEKFITDGHKTVIQQRSDFITYPEFLKYFTDLDEITKHNLIIGINFVYGWMPTIFDFRSDNFNLAIDILNQAKKGNELITEDQLTLLKGLFNNSLVGSTKLLHFINPEKYAIWDSRVFRYLTGSNNYNQIEKCNNYFHYLTFCKELIESDQDAFKKLKNQIEVSVGYTMTPFRVIDLIMYLNTPSAPPLPKNE
jgi:hypothetical protein